VLFVGDTLYEWAVIVFPLEGNLGWYNETLKRLKGLVQAWNADTAQGVPRAKMACGHVTSGADAEELLEEVQVFFDKVVDGSAQERDKGDWRDEKMVAFERADGKISFQGPKKLFDAYRKEVKG